jgi:UDP-N-acetylmuramoyl-tripeptide--D-alanyl-D-alanine ligase
LAEIAEPTVGVVTNVNAVHLEFFDTVDGIARAKRELIEGLPANGTAVLNADDARVREFASVHPGPAVTFGIDQPADFRAADVEQNASSGVRFRATARGRAGAVEFTSSLPGRHNVSNMLAAIATASVFGIEPGELPDALSSVGAGRIRGEILDLGGVRIISDCYNSNPRAVAAMLDVLRESPAQRRIAVLGEMRELGASSVELHRETGMLAARLGLDLLIGVAGDAREIAKAAREAGMPAVAAEFLDTAEEAGERLASIVRPGDYVLLKGSRGVALEKALAILESARGQASPVGAEGRG